MRNQYLNLDFNKKSTLRKSLKLNLMASKPFQVVVKTKKLRKFAVIPNISSFNVTLTSQI